MSRNLYILAAVLAVLALASFGMSFTSSPALPGETPLWRMMALVLFLLAAVSSLAATLTRIYEQASRRHYERKLPPGSSNKAS